MEIKLVFESLGSVAYPAIAGRGGLACPADMRDANMMYCVYILKSIKDGSYYIGCTSNLKKRLLAHNAGRAYSLKNKRPLEIVYKEDYTGATDAYAREKQIKSYKGGDAFKKLIKGSVA